MSQNYLAIFAELIRTPFQHLELVWGIVPLYFALLLSELTSVKKSFRTAIQTGFSFLWAGLSGYIFTEPSSPQRLPAIPSSNASRQSTSW